MVATLAWIAAWTVFRLWFSTKLELTGDEAYYWLWSKHLDLSYCSKGPGVAWAIRFGTSLFGDTAFGVRFPAVMLSALSGVLLYLLGVRLFDSRTGFWTAVTAGLIPLFFIGSILMTIDPLSVAFWLAAILALWRAKDTMRTGPWALAGLLVGLGALCKYTNLVQLVCCAGFCLTSRGYRRHLARPTFWTMVLVAAACLAPIIIWNRERGWITLIHLRECAKLDSGFRFSPLQFAEFWALQLLVFSPLLYAGLVYSVAGKGVRRCRPAAHRMLVWHIAPLYAAYSCLALNDAGQPNWTAPALAASLPLLAGTWLPLSAAHARARRFSVGALSLAAASIALLAASVFFRPPLETDLLDRARGWRGLAADVLAQVERCHADFALTSHYQLASHLAFCLPAPRPVFRAREANHTDQFSFWPGYQDGSAGRTALFVSSSPDVPAEVIRGFRSVVPMGHTFRRWRERPLKKYYFHLCEGLRLGSTSPSRAPLERTRDPQRETPSPPGGEGRG